MKQRIARPLFIFIAALFIFNQGLAETISRKAVQSIIDEHGYDIVIKTLVSVGDGSVTLRDGSVRFGRPASDLVDAETISRDLERNRISLASFEAYIRKTTERATIYPGATSAPITSSRTTEPTDSPTSDDALTSTCANGIRARLLDPDSMRIALKSKPMFATTKYQGSAIVVRKVFMYVRAKNSYGGYVEPRLWVCELSEHSGKLLTIHGP